MQEKDKFFTVDKYYNGYDSTKQYKLGTNNGFESITNQKEIEGIIYNQPFSIKFSALNQQRTILLNNKIVFIVEGLTKPHQMVESNTNISQELKNLLLLIAYGEIFQSPN